MRHQAQNPVLKCHPEVLTAVIFMSQYCRLVKGGKQKMILVLSTETRGQKQTLSEHISDCLTDGGMGLGFLSLQRVLKQIEF